MKKNKLSEDAIFMLARSAYEMGEYDEAKGLYEDILTKNPSNSRVKLELAQTCFRLGEYTRAKELYDEVLSDSSLPDEVRKKVELHVASLNKASQKNFFKTTLSIGYGYDSNTDNITNDEYINWGSLPLLLPSKKSDHLSEYIVALNHTYKLSSNLSLDNRLVGFMQKYNKDKDNDIALAIFGTGLSYYTKNSKSSVAFEYQYVNLDKKSYLYNYAFVPSFDYKIDKDMLYKAKLRVMKKDFKQAAYNFRDSTYYELSNTLMLLSDTFGINSISFVFGTDNKNSGKAWNVDYDFVSLAYTNSFPLSTSTLLNSGVELYSDRYKTKEEVLYQNKKRDDRVVLDLGVLQSINKNFSFGVALRYIDNASNQSIYEYDKYTIKTNLYYSF